MSRLRKVPTTALSLTCQTADMQSPTPDYPKPDYRPPTQRFSVTSPRTSPRISLVLLSMNSRDQLTPQHVSPLAHASPRRALATTHDTMKTTSTTVAHNYRSTKSLHYSPQVQTYTKADCYTYICDILWYIRFPALLLVSVWPSGPLWIWRDVGCHSNLVCCSRGMLDAPPGTCVSNRPVCAGISVCSDVIV